MWIARDMNNDLYVYSCKPVRNEKYGMFNAPRGVYYKIDSSLCKQVTFDNSPKRFVIV